jgi:hypothetical protein
MLSRVFCESKGWLKSSKMKKFLSTTVFLVLLASLSYAQPGNPGGGTDPDVPITGIEVLIGLGGALGLKKMMSKKKK